MVQRQACPWLDHIRYAAPGIGIGIDRRRLRSRGHA
jgi:hypothetical protein